MTAGRVDQRVGDGVVQRVAVNVRSEGRRVGGRRRGGGDERLGDLEERQVVAADDDLREREDLLVEGVAAHSGANIRRRMAASP